MPIIPKVSAKLTQFMIAKFRSRNRLMGTRGVFRKWSQTRNRTSTTAPAPITSGIVTWTPRQVVIVLQSYLWPSINPKVMRNSAADASSTPTSSRPARRPGRRSGTRTSAIASVTTPTGRFT